MTSSTREQVPASRGDLGDEVEMDLRAVGDGVETSLRHVLALGYMHCDVDRARLGGRIPACDGVTWEKQA